MQDPPVFLFDGARALAVKRRWVLAGVITAAALAGCSEPDPKAECVRYQVEQQQLDNRWGVRPAIGMSPIEGSAYRDKFENDHPNYAADQEKLRKQFGQRLNTSSIDMFCQSYW